MRRRLGGRFWIEVALALANLALVALTLVWNQWIELVFRVDPDQGSGQLEWTVVGVALAVTIVSLMLARLEWRRARAAL